MPLMTRPEVEDLAGSTAIARARAKDLASGKPTDKDERVGRGDVEVLTVHFLFRKFDELANPLNDRMVGSHHPESLFLPVGPPLQVTGRSHQPPENLRKVCRMEDDQPHSIEDSPLHALDNFVRDLLMVHMSPPD